MSCNISEIMFDLEQHARREIGQAVLACLEAGQRQARTGHSAGEVQAQMALRMRAFGVSAEMAEEYARRLVTGGQRTVVAQRTEQALSRMVDRGAGASSEVVTDLRGVRS
jgi:hypothetical protein